MEIVYLTGSNNYYRVGNKVFNSRGMELKPDRAGRYKIRRYKNSWFYARITDMYGNSNIPYRYDITKLQPLVNYPGYYTDLKDVYNKWGNKLRQQKGYYKLKNSDGEWRNIRL